MTFQKFESIVKSARPECNVYNYGVNKVGVDFPSKYPTEQNKGRTKIYTYTGSYIQIINALKIKAYYKFDRDLLAARLNEYKEENGKENEWFGGINDYSSIIEDLESQLKDIDDNYIIIE